uniref:Uncharacterized protein n=1 Tax=viral metagenome TaxID=1070528 RepID=A0A6M3LEE9_9ZZZZ
MSYIKDPVGLSLIWGRVGAAVLALIAFGLGIWGYTLSPEDQASAAELIGSIMAGVAGLFAIISKVREGKKAKE